jgi:transcriptional regulator with XRE-family HTH domain
MDKIRVRHIDFLNKMRRRTGLSLSALAHKAGLSDSTLTRFIKKESHKRLSTATLDKLSQAGGYDSYEDYLYASLEDNLDSEGGFNEIDDAKKFEIYEGVKRILNKTSRDASPPRVAALSQEVLDHAKRLNTSFIHDSLIAYVIERSDHN